MSSVAAAILVFPTHGLAFAALSEAGVQSQVEVLEIIPLGMKAQLLIKGERSALDTILFRISVKSESCLQISDWNLQIEKAFYSLENSEPQGALAFVESESLGALLQLAHEALGVKMQIVDLKIPRGSSLGGLLILTAETIPAAWEQATREKGFQVTLVADPSPALQKYFSIEAYSASDIPQVSKS